MTTIHRLACDIDRDFEAPRNVTFGWQEARQQFSVWFKEGDAHDCLYRIVGIGHGIDAPFTELVATVVLPDGFHAFHVVRLRGEK